MASEVISKVTKFMGGESNIDSYSEYIYYCASEEDAKNFEAESEISKFADSSKAAHRQTHEAQHTIINRINAVQLDVGHVNGDLKKEMAELREKVMHAHCHDELKKELEGLRELVKLLVKRSDGEYGDTEVEPS